MTYLELASSAVPDYVERLQFRDDVLQIVQSISDQARDTEIQSMLAFLRDHLAMRLAMPNEQIGYFAMPESLMLEDAVFLAAIRTYDGWHLDEASVARRFAQPALAATMYGAYYRTTHTIYLPMDWPLRRMWTGLALLHESVHAYDHLGGDNRFYRFRKGQSELHARRIEHRALTALYGEKLTKSLQLLPLQSEVRRRFNNREASGLWYPDENQFSDAMLDDVFGVAASRTERYHLRSIFGRAVIQQYLSDTPAGVSIRKLAVLPV